MDVFEMKFAKVYPLLITKAERKGRTRQEVFDVTRWLMGYTDAQLEALLLSDATYGQFIDGAPALNPSRFNVKGRICGIKVEEIEDPRMRTLRILDKLVDDLSKGKAIEKILSV